MARLASQPDPVIIGCPRPPPGRPPTEPFPLAPENCRASSGRAARSPDQQPCAQLCSRRRRIMRRPPRNKARKACGESRRPADPVDPGDQEDRLTLAEAAQIPHERPCACQTGLRGPGARFSTDAQAASAAGILPPACSHTPSRYAASGLFDQPPATIPDRHVRRRIGPVPSNAVLALNFARGAMPHRARRRREPARPTSASGREASASAA